MIGFAIVQSFMICGRLRLGERTLPQHEDHLRLIVAAALAPLDQRDDPLGRFFGAEQRHRVRHQARDVHVPAQDAQHAVVGQPVVVAVEGLGRVEVVLRERQAARGDRRPRVHEAEEDDVELAVGPADEVAAFALDDLDVGAVVEVAGARAVVAHEPQHQRVELDRA